MALNYEPKTAEQIAKERLLPDGEYDVECIAAKNDVAKSGNDMIVLMLNIHGERVIKTIDYIVCTLDYKMNNACSAFGVLDEYFAKTLDASDFVDKWARAKIASTDGSDGYDPKNIVKKYLPPKVDKAAATKAAVQKFTKETAKVAEENGDDVPF